MPRLSPVPATLVGGALAGAIDITYATVFSYFRGIAPMRILQSVASGLLGRGAFDGGAPTALLGLALHFFIALTAATVYALAATRLRALTRSVVIYGIVYGLAIYAVMNYIVLPLSAFPGRIPTDPLVVVTGVLVHMFGIGLPIAWFSGRAIAERQA